MHGAFSNDEANLLSLDGIEPKTISVDGKNVQYFTANQTSDLMYYAVRLTRLRLFTADRMMRIDDRRSRKYKKYEQLCEKILKRFGQLHMTLARWKVNA